ncbi:hypothetical protein PDJAM_G00164330 [Pangasius djambal]|uniref:Uncharacterized protein n=1 Tax=Pangasius djambal TaxID=1691987 RepID=A0ACC5ZKJ7_9TELE|nr:hypothetical protein [Pangasius djambal]
MLAHPCPLLSVKGVIRGNVHRCRIFFDAVHPTWSVSFRVELENHRSHASRISFKMASSIFFLISSYPIEPRYSERPSLHLHLQFHDVERMLVFHALTRAQASSRVSPSEVTRSPRNAMFTILFFSRCFSMNSWAAWMVSVGRHPGAKPHCLAALGFRVTMFQRRRSSTRSYIFIAWHNTRIGRYHKVQKKAKRKEFLKQFDEMMKTDPAAALEELKKMELSRMEERMSLKHQNSGKWAKTKAIMAKYDDSARKAMQQQLELNKELTQKLVVPSDDDDEGNDDEEASALPDFVNDPESADGSVNPWMRGKLSSEGHGVTADPDTTTAEEPASSQQREEEQDQDEEEEENEEEQLLRHFETKRKLRQDEEDDLVPVAQEEEDGAQEDAGETARDVQEEEKVEAEEEEDEEEEEQEEVVSEFNALFNRLMKSTPTPTEPPPGKASRPQEAELAQEEEGLLDEGLVRARTVEDLEALVHDGTVEETAVSVSHAASVDTASEPHSKKKKKKEIDPSEVLTKDANVIKVPLAPTLVEGDEGEEEEGPSAQMSIIKEAFAGDDVISDFLKDKKRQEEAGQPKVVDLTLPGWGEWGGVGLKPSRYKRRKFRLKPPPAAPRKDQKLPAVIISEKRNSSIALHQVSQLPFPFQESAQFETCIRSPVGQTWNTQNTVKKLTAPKVVTKLGSIIEPLRKEDFLPEEKSAGALRKQPQIVLEEKGGNAGKRGGGARRTQQQKKKKKK